jgi:hypothetical protein
MKCCPSKWVYPAAACGLLAWVSGMVGIYYPDYREVGYGLLFIFWIPMTVCVCVAQWQNLKHRRK